VVLDVPLLFETGTDGLCDVTMMAWAPMRLIRTRALMRPHMTDGKLAAILAKQMPQFEKMKLADEKIATGLGYASMTRQIHRLLWKWHLR
jgi:dephospho-CoA kinase